MRRNEFLKFRIANDERRVLEIMARNERRNMSEMMRELVREGAQRRGLYAVSLVDITRDNQLQPI